MRPATLGWCNGSTPDFESGDFLVRAQVREPMMSHRILRVVSPRDRMGRTYEDLLCDKNCDECKLRFECYTEPANKTLAIFPEDMWKLNGMFVKPYITASTYSQSRMERGIAEALDKMGERRRR